jgi:beta-mannosidase
MLSGIGKPVKILAWNIGRIADITLNLLDLSQEKALLQLLGDIELDIKSFKNLSIMGSVFSEGYKVAESRVNISISDIESSSNQSSEKIESNRDVVRKNLSLLIPDPKLWWIHSLGQPFLYQINITLFEGDTVIDSRIMDYGKQICMEK